MDQCCNNRCSNVKDIRPPALAPGLAPLLLPRSPGQLPALGLGFTLDLVSVVLDLAGHVLGCTSGGLRLASDSIPLGVPGGAFGLSGEEILIDANVQDKLASSTVLDDTLLSGSGVGEDAGTLGEDGAGEDGLQVVGRSRSCVGGGDGSLLQTVELEIGLLEVFGDLDFKSVRNVAL